MLSIPRTKSPQKQRGISLVEMMVGMTVGLIIVAATLSVYITSLRGGSDTLRSAKLNMELRSAMDVMVAEIRRSGFTLDTTVLSNNPFMATSTNLTLVGSDCLLFSYDTNADAVVNTSDFFGFKKNGSAISMRHGGTAPSTSPDCGVNADAWEKITDDKSIVINELTFSINYQCWNSRLPPPSPASPPQRCVAGQSIYDAAVAAAPTKSDLVEVREVTINLVGHHIKDPLLTMTLNQSVKVRNDRVQTVP